MGPGVEVEHEHLGYREMGKRIIVGGRDGSFLSLHPSLISIKGKS